MQGERGSQGERGLLGEQGSRGFPGALGLLGEQGQQGEQGAPGEEGSVGEQGPPGPPGDIPQGQRGPQGEQGSRGARGPQGEQGPQGPRGDQGPQGISGPRGEARSYVIAYSEGMERPPVVPDSRISLPDSFRVEGIEDTYRFQWTKPERGDPHYAGSLAADGQVWQLYPPHVNNTSRTSGFCKATEWATVLRKEPAGIKWHSCRDQDRAGERLAESVVEWLDEAKGLSSQLHTYRVSD